MNGTTTEEFINKEVSKIIIIIHNCFVSGGMGFNEERRYIRKNEYADILISFISLIK